ncbi:MAG TPA: hypothetical protein VKH81_21415 [Candidatus Angelobacter sp.]|nr:hypothetical protein [Candidatus Angelobacter sp.]
MRRSLCRFIFLLTILPAVCNASSDQPPPATHTSTEITIPGPLRSFLRMAGLSQKAAPEEVLPLLAQEVRIRAYDRGKATEFLVLLQRYLRQARELAALAGSDGTIRVSTCDDAKPLMAVLGYRLHEACGPNSSLQTSDPDRAFLTIDSGFPLAQLEETLQGGRPFVLPFPSSHIPVLFTEKDWADVHGESSSDILQTLLHDPALARLYSAMARMDSETVVLLRQSPGLRRMVRYADVLDFYGGHIYVRSGHVVVPGGIASAAAWKNLVGASPDSAPEFITRLLSKDEGWLAAYFDALSSVGSAQQAYFADPQRLQRFYEALRSGNLSPGAARPVFRPAPHLPLLVARLYIEPGGKPHAPGGLEAWQPVFRLFDDSRISKKLASRAGRWKDPEQLVAAMFALSREQLNTEPLQLYLILSEMDRARTPDQWLSAQTVRLLAEKFQRFGDQYPVFCEFNSLDNEAISAYLKTATALDNIPAPALRANAIGTFQATLGLWQILARQKEIPEAQQSDSWQHLLARFTGISSPVQLFDAGRNAVGELLHAASGKSDLSQDELVLLLAGPAQPTHDGQMVRDEIAKRIQAVFDAQRLVSLDTLFSLGSGLSQLGQGKTTADSLLPLAAELREFEMPRPIFTPTEKIQFQRDHADTRHTTLQTRTNLTRIIKTGSPQELAEARGQLAPFIRDTLVGLNYAYYEPPGAQMLLNNAIFVRSHDYSEDYRSGRAGIQPWKTPSLVNLGATASGGTHLAGSLADLPYTLALVEQDFIVPESVQSLIWQDLVPSLITSAILPRWWYVTPHEMHAVTLYQRTGEEILIAAAEDSALREKVMDILSDRMTPQQLGQVENSMQPGHAQEALALVLPAETFYLAAEFRRRFADDIDHAGNAGRELEKLQRDYPAETSSERIARDFGVPHPALARNYSRDLLNIKLFPSFESYSSRLLAESWESNNLYWARLADEKGYPPVMLNRLVPELTRRMVERLFASSLEDWPAIRRAMRETGEDFRSGRITLAKDGSGPRPD